MTDSNGTDVGDLTQVKSHNDAGASSCTHGYTMGGGGGGGTDTDTTTDTVTAAKKIAEGIDEATDPSTDPSGQSIPFNHPSIAGTSIPFPEQSQREMAMAGYRVEHEPPQSFEHMYNAPSSVTGRYEPGQDTGPPSGLLSEPMVDRWGNSMMLPTKQEDLSLLADNSNTKKSGWEKDKPFNDALTQMMMQWGMNQVADDEF